MKGIEEVEGRRQRTDRQSSAVANEEEGEKGREEWEKVGRAVLCWNLSSIDRAMGLSEW